MEIPSVKHRVKHVIASRIQVKVIDSYEIQFLLC